MVNITEMSADKLYSCEFIGTMKADYGQFSKGESVMIHRTDVMTTAVIVDDKLVAVPTPYIHIIEDDEK